MGFKSGLNRMLFASRARELPSGAEKAPAMTAETRALTCGIAKNLWHQKAKPVAAHSTRHAPFITAS